MSYFIVFFCLHEAEVCSFAVELLKTYLNNLFWTELALKKNAYHMTIKCLIVAFDWELEFVFTSCYEKYIFLCLQVQ